LLVVMMLYPMLGQADMGNALRRAQFPRL